MKGPAQCALLAVSLASACGGNGEAAGQPTPCPSVTPVPRRDMGLLPDVPLAEHGTVTEITVKRGYLGAQAVTTTSIVELYPPLGRAVLDAGYDIVSSENEGFEAEIFFARGRGITGAYRLREGPCKDQVTIKLLYGSKRYRKENK